MTTRLISTAAFNAAFKSDPAKVSDKSVFRVTAGTPKMMSESERRLRFCFSDGTVDRAGDTIAGDGWDTVNFAKNPVALWAHDSSQPPIGRASNLMVEDGRLMGDISFVPADVYSFAETIYGLVKGGWLNAVSVGFLPIEYDWAEEGDGRSSYGVDFKRQELLEISVVPVPANPNALIEARAKGVDTAPLAQWIERILDSPDLLVVRRQQLVNALKGAQSPAPRRRKIAGSDNPSSHRIQEARVPTATQRQIERAARAAARAEVRRAGRRRNARRRDAEEDLPNVMAEDVSDALDDSREAHDKAMACHTKAIGLHKEAIALHEEAMGHHKDAMDALDEAEDLLGQMDDEHPSEDEPAEGTDERAAATRALRQRLGV